MVQGLGRLRFEGLGFRVYGLGLGVEELRAEGAKGLGFSPPPPLSTRKM